jgi:hypothetical protein
MIMRAGVDETERKRVPNIISKMLTLDMVRSLNAVVALANANVEIAGSTNRKRIMFTPALSEERRPAYHKNLVPLN